MEQFDSEVEKALNRAGKASAWLTVLAVAMIILGIAGGVLGGVGVALSSFAGAALIYGVAVIINLLGMQLVVSWGQIRQSKGTPK
ncbi:MULTISPECIES: hypothetical protein [Glycomyces]|uniref:Uncharacterized protein n=2 Tax=Glycomyces TaxID=58113 RepID=A0A9X3PG69_9ACTN|nr:hypothetical protein [Glycomyces lechevalierae]MDA1384924.1 hypothetical protein [Glycomyces lechevalierae]MDR7337624.1 hypothetical protein [Glycomyces lechevalierae]